MGDEDALHQGLYLVSMAQVYPEDRGTNYAVREGKRWHYAGWRNLQSKRHVEWEQAMEGGGSHSANYLDSDASARPANACVTDQAAANALRASIADWPNAQGIDWLDRSVVGYLVLPLVIFLVGWCNFWAAVALIGCVGFSLAPLVRRILTSPRPGVSVSVVLLSFATATTWGYLGGIGHFLFTNGDWFIRDAVLRDLVVSPWPVGYGELQGQETLLRTSVAYFLPAAALGKVLGLQAAQPLLLVWTALGAGLFFLQVITLLPRGKSAIATALLVVTFFSGMDVVGGLLNGGEYFRSTWSIDAHLERWDEDYEYSSMTTQLFWAPNHALGGWLFVGLLLRNNTLIYKLLPMVLVSLLLWSPFAALGVMPFLLWGYVTNFWRARLAYALSPRNWIGALLVAIPVVGYVTLDTGGIHKGIVSMTATWLTQTLQFFLLEVGIVGWIVYALRPSALYIVSLIVLLVLPVGDMGMSNDLVLRASIPSLAVLVIGVCMALTAPAASARAKLLRLLLIVFLCAGAVTPIQEIARGFVWPRWAPRNDVSLVGASCGHYWHHYIAKLGDSPIRYLLHAPSAAPPSARSPDRWFCDVSDD